MGSLARFDIQEIINKYSCYVLFETGTGAGASLASCARYPFSRLLSCEVFEPLHEAATTLFKHDRRIEILFMASEAALQQQLPALDPSTPILFFLDAHYPGADFGLSGYEDEANERIRLPLEHELKLIHELRDSSMDVIIIDDLRIYENGPFENGDADPEKHPRSTNGLAFVDRLFSATHSIRRIYADEGYLVLVPKHVQPSFPSPASLLGDIADSNEALRRLHQYLGVGAPSIQQFEALIDYFAGHMRSPGFESALEPWVALADETSRDAPPGTQIAISGTGIFAAVLCARLLQNGHRPVAFCTQETDKIGRAAKGIPVISHQGCADLQPDRLVVASASSKQRLRDRYLLGFPENADLTTIYMLPDTLASD